VRFEVVTAASVKFLTSGLLRHVVRYKFTDVSEVHAASIIREMVIVLMMEAAGISETSVYYTAQ
jgi:hypothetical protein